MFQAKAFEKIKTHFVFNKQFFFPRKSCLYEMMWKNIVDPDRSQMTNLCQYFVPTFSVYNLRKNPVLQMNAFIYCAKE
jgi:hypothetical protein